MKPRILVLGGSGFVGAEVVRVLCEHGHVVRATRRVGERVDVGEVSGEISGDVEWVEVDLGDVASIGRVLQGCVAVIHAAGYEPGGKVTVREGLREGVGELRRVLDGCLAEGVMRIVYVSSAATIHSGQAGRVFDETDFYTPGQYEDVYFEVKYSMEAELYRYFDRGLEIIVGLPSMVLGAGCERSSSGRLLQGMLKEARSKGGQDWGEERVNVVDVRDLARALVTAMERGRAGRRYVLGGVNTDFGSLLEGFARVLETKGQEEEGVGGVGGLSGRLREQAVDRIKSVVVERVTERFLRRVVAGEGSVLRSSYREGIQRYSGHVNSQRSRGELGHRPRLLAQTVAASAGSFLEES